MVWCYDITSFIYSLEIKKCLPSAFLWSQLLISDMMQLHNKFDRYKQNGFHHHSWILHCTCRLQFNNMHAGLQLLSLCIISRPGSFPGSICYVSVGVEKQPGIFAHAHHSHKNLKICAATFTIMLYIVSYSGMTAQVTRVLQYSKQNDEFRLSVEYIATCR